MTSLHELQRAMRASILAGGDSLGGLVLADGLSAEGRLQIYRNNTFISLTAALEATFPVVCRLVDDRFFDYAADTFIRSCPPRRPCLAEYGAEFPGFLGEFPPARSLAYLADVARLEWALNLAYHAPDVAPVDAGRLAGVAQSSYAGLRFVLQPSCYLLESPFPVDRIWEANQPGADGHVDADLAQGCRLAIHRKALEVRFFRVSHADFRFMRAIADGATIEQAYLAAASVDAGFDATAILSTCLSHALLADLVEPPSAG